MLPPCNLSPPYESASSGAPSAAIAPFLPLSTQLPAPLAVVLNDFQAIFERDPSARNPLEVVLCYPGFHALLSYRLAHGLHRRRVPFLPRLISHLARMLTGIEIHPGAVLGRGIVIDHGMGVVIGETAIVGDFALIYQGVTLGGTGKEQGKRHPTVGSHVVLGAGAKVLGNIQVGDRARVGAGSVVLRSVPADCTAVGIPARLVCRRPATDAPLDHQALPDTEAAVLRSLLNRIQHLEQEIQKLQQPASSPDQTDWIHSLEREAQSFSLKTTVDSI